MTLPPRLAPGAIARHFGGVVLIHKPSGISSQYALTQIRRRFGLKKIGHGGTLDPLAQGLLVCALSEATKFLSYGNTGHKIYKATARLGLTSDTEDRLSKNILSHCSPDEINAISSDRLIHCLKQFEGHQLQIPPVYSALKHQGQCLYAYARKGHAVSVPKARSIYIKQIDQILLKNEGYFEFRVECGAGTYIRSLVRDIGKYLGCGALLMELTRQASFPFFLKDAYPLETLLNLDEDHFFCHVVRPIEHLCVNLPKIFLPPQAIHDLTLGRSVDFNSAFFTNDLTPFSEESALKKTVTIFDEEWNLFCGIGQYDYLSREISPTRWISNFLERKRQVDAGFLEQESRI